MTEKSAAIIIAILAAGAIYAQRTGSGNGTSAGEWSMLAGETVVTTTTGRGETQPTVFMCNRHTGVACRYFAICDEYDRAHSSRGSG